FSCVFRSSSFVLCSSRFIADSSDSDHLSESAGFTPLGLLCWCLSASASRSTRLLYCDRSPMSPSVQIFAVVSAMLRRCRQGKGRRSLVCQLTAGVPVLVGCAAPIAWLLYAVLRPSCCVGPFVAGPSCLVHLYDRDPSRCQSVFSLNSA